MSIKIFAHFPEPRPVIHRITPDGIPNPIGFGPGYAFARDTLSRVAYGPAIDTPRIDWTWVSPEHLHPIKPQRESDADCSDTQTPTVSKSRKAARKTQLRSVLAARGLSEADISDILSLI